MQRKDQAALALELISGKTIALVADTEISKDDLIATVCWGGDKQADAFGERNQGNIRRHVSA
ncbi:hypothetical protein GQ600_7791 [Phytophthora cactorum]|nr:hypothetical protein GQ600_7791 [Phytophthora cactorum]